MPGTSSACANPRSSKSIAALGVSVIARVRRHATTQQARIDTHMNPAYGDQVIRGKVQEELVFIRRLTCVLGSRLGRNDQLRDVEAPSAVGISAVHRQHAASFDAPVGVVSS